MKQSQEQTAKQRLVARCLRLTLRLLLWYLEYGNVPNQMPDKAEQWLAGTWEHPGFQAWFKARDRKFVKDLAGGVGLIEQKREDYIRKTGQRVETLQLAFRAKQAFERASEERRRKAQREG